VLKLVPFGDQTEARNFLLRYFDAIVDFVHHWT
jgi:hypothetical protein